MKTLYNLVGIKQANAGEFVASLEDGEELTLVREPDNQYDPNAIRVEAKGVKIGYIGRGRDPSSEKYKPGRENEPLARYIDACGRPGPERGEQQLRITGRLVPGQSPQIEVEEA